ncbi:hypothetical protein WN943_001028 [Citrus x changshan-huyou]
MKAYEIPQMAKRSHFNKTYRYKTRDDGNGAVATTADREAMVAVCSPIIDESFNLDEALTMITNTSSTPPDQDQPKSHDGQTNSELTVSSLPTVAATEGRCTVCMENFLQAFPGKQVPCGHVFHATCISTWISLSNSCPVCRSGVIA